MTEPTRSAQRMFLGVLPPRAVREIVAERARAAIGGAIGRVYAADDVHLTLVFLGSVDAARARALEDGLAAAFAGARPVALRIGGVGAFPPRVLWAGLDLDDAARRSLEDLVARGRRLATDAGIELARADLERPFTPHLTIARPKDGERAPAELARLRFDVDWVATEVGLFASTGSDGPEGRYPVRATVALGRG